jgi:hypothetical protein
VHWRFVGRARERWLVCEGPGGVALVDVRRAQRLCLVRRARAELAGGRLASQRLLFAVEGAAPALERLGFDLRPAGPRALALHAVPRLFGAGPVEPMAADLIEATVAGELAGARLETLLELLAARTAAVACDEPDALVAELAAVPDLLEQTAAVVVRPGELAAALEPDPP